MIVFSWIVVVILLIVAILRTCYNEYPAAVYYLLFAWFVADMANLNQYS